MFADKMNAKTLLTLYKKETKYYFSSPTAYIVTVVFLLITGYFFAQSLFLMNQATINAFSDIAPLLLVFIVPSITMSLMAEEMKSGTMEILATLPIEDAEILLSKFAAAMTLVLFILGTTFTYPLTVGILGKLDWGAAFGSYAGLAFTSLILASAGLFASTLTKNQIVAFMLAFLIGFVFFLLGKIHMVIPPAISPVTNFLGFDSHLDNLSRGILDTRDIFYYLSVSGFFLYLSYLRLEARKT